MDPWALPSGGRSKSAHAQSAAVVPPQGLGMGVWASLRLRQKAHSIAGPWSHMCSSAPPDMSPFSRPALLTLQARPRRCLTHIARRRPAEPDARSPSRWDPAVRIFNKPCRPFSHARRSDRLCSRLNQLCTSKAATGQAAALSHPVRGRPGHQRAPCSPHPAPGAAPRHAGQSGAPTTPPDVSGSRSKADPEEY